MKTRSYSTFGVPLEQFLADARAVDLKWAAIAEAYRVDSFAPSSEIDFQVFREYFDTDWQDEQAHRQAAEISNEYQSDVLPVLRDAFEGYRKVIGKQPIEQGFASQYDEHDGRDTELEAVISAFFRSF